MCDGCDRVVRETITIAPPGGRVQARPQHPCVHAYVRTPHCMQGSGERGYTAKQTICIGSDPGWTGCVVQ